MCVIILGLSGPQNQRPKLKKTWVKINTCAFVTSAGYSKLKTECLSKVDSRTQGPTNCGQLKKHLQMGCGAQVFIFSTLYEPTKLMGGIHPVSGPIWV